ncbi:HEAT repeat domain-containing protein [Methanosarcina mazei]|nr:HEAT repeat domain-containing protein [Methanosarcina mazei]
MEEIYNQCLSKDSNENIKALKQLKNNFSSISDKRKAWNDLIQLTSSKHCNVKYLAAYTLDFVFSEIPNKKQAWNDLIKLTNNKDPDVKKYATYAFTLSFSEMPDKQQVWKDLIVLTTDEDKYIRIWSSHILIYVFPEINDKKQAWKDLIALMINDQNSVVRQRAASTLAYVFSYMPDKQQAWEDLISQDNDKISFLRSRTDSILASIFPQVPDKHDAWSGLCKLVNKKDSVRFSVIPAILSAFSEMPDKQQAWSDLFSLITDQDYNAISSEYLFVTSNAFNVLVSFFSELPDKQKAWSDLDRLSTNKDRFLRTYANHSLGKISIYRAAQAEKDEDYKKELEKAIEFFEKAAKESRLDNPAQFCLPFYRSFHTIIFEKQEAKEGVDKYLIQARHAIKGSKSKKLLFRSVENLANALKEVQSLRNLDLETKRRELNFYRQYCDRASELMKYSEETAPYATGVLRKGLPIFDRNLKKILEEVQSKAKIACKESKGTDTEEIACTVNQEVKNWEIGSQEEMTQNIENLAYVLEEKISVQPKNQFILSKIEQMKSERNLVNQYEILAQIITLIRNVTVVPEDTVKEGFENLNKGINNIYDKFEEMSISLNPKNRAELVISKGIMIGGIGAQVVSTIPLEKISYPELLEDLENIKERAIKVSELPGRLVNKIKSYLS